MVEITEENTTGAENNSSKKNSQIEFVDKAVKNQLTPFVNVNKNGKIKPMPINFSSINSRIKQLQVKKADTNRFINNMRSSVNYHKKQVNNLKTQFNSVQELIMKDKFTEKNITERYQQSLPRQLRTNRTINNGEWDIGYPNINSNELMRQQIALKTSLNKLNVNKTNISRKIKISENTIKNLNPVILKGQSNVRNYTRRISNLLNEQNKYANRQRQMEHRLRKGVLNKLASATQHVTKRKQENRNLNNIMEHERNKKFRRMFNKLSNAAPFKK
jgi:chromosome segregation ATPase